MKQCSLTDVGIKREMNQDYLFASPEPIGALPNLFIVADGMGGHQAGDFASRRTVEIMVQAAEESGDTAPAQVLSEGIQKANHELRVYAGTHAEMLGMGTTVVAAVLMGETMLVANVGDSRLYVVGDTLTQVTRDHSLVQEMVRMGELDAESAKSHPDRNIITRAVGAEFEVMPEFFEVDLQPGQQVLLCSDGLTGMVDDETIYAVLSGSDSLEDKTKRLVSLANQNGGSDNITVIMIDPE